MFLMFNVKCLIANIIIELWGIREIMEIREIGEIHTDALRL